jgi:hypothetical protein
MQVTDSFVEARDEWKQVTCIQAKRLSEWKVSECSTVPVLRLTQCESLDVTHSRVSES